MATTLYVADEGNATITTNEPNPTKLVMITDALAATALPTDDEHRDGSLEKFVTLQASRSGEVYRGGFMAPLKRHMGRLKRRHRQMLN